jgi:hypothetical protein
MVEAGTNQGSGAPTLPFSSYHITDISADLVIGPRVRIDVLRRGSSSAYCTLDSYCAMLNRSGILSCLGCDVPCMGSGVRSGQPELVMP